MSTEPEVQSVYFDIAKSLSKLSNAEPVEGCVAVVNESIVSTGFTYKSSNASTPSLSTTMCVMNYLSRMSGSKDVVEFYVYSEDKKSSASELTNVLTFFDVPYEIHRKLKYQRSSNADCGHKSSHHITVKPGSKPKLYGTATCPLCGDAFDRKSPRQKYCNHWKIGICESCHKVFQYKCDGKKKPRTCGDRKCVGALRVSLIGDARKKRFESGKEN